MLLSYFPHPFPLLPSKPHLLYLTSPSPKPHAHLLPLHASSSSTSTTATSPPPELLAKSALRRISDKLRSLGYLETPTPTPTPTTNSPGEIFAPTPTQLPHHRVGSTLDPSWAAGAGEAAARRRQGRKAAPAPPSAAELAVRPDELRRLRGIGIRLRKRLKVGKAGVTEGVVNGIHERWRNAELVKVKCEDVCRMNMQRTHEILERKTGGLVIWRSGSTIILYRGAKYKYPYFHDRERRDVYIEEESSKQSSGGERDEDPGIASVEHGNSGEEGVNLAEHSSSGEDNDNLGIVYVKRIVGEENVNHGMISLELSSSREKDTKTAGLSSEQLGVEEQKGNFASGSSEQINDRLPSEQRGRLHMNTPVGPPHGYGAQARSSLVAGVGSPTKFRLQLPGEVKLAEEADKLLDGLGPRFSDWWGYDPLPVDADLLPAIIPGFRRPFRLIPSGVQPKLTDREMTILRRLARPLPCHYALGRNTNLQGLAASMIKLWERCEVGKIAIKRGVQNIDSELISEELKALTGGTLLSRDEGSIVFYRGKDFLPAAVSHAMEQRRKHGNSTISKPNINIEESTPTQDASDLKTTDASLHGHEEKHEKDTSNTEKRMESLDMVVQNVEARLSHAIAAKERAEKLLEDLEKTSQTPKVDSNEEAISEEERYMLRKVGLKMKPFLLLGRRGVFDGTIENMHLHWKYRELVKIICKEHRIEDVEYAARTLEAESGGILVAVKRVTKGHAIIIYRGKNYRRPSTLRPKSLLNKRDALKRSVESQRHKSLKLHVLNLSKNIEDLRHQMQMENQPMTDSIQMSSGHENEDRHDVIINSATFEDNSEEVREVAPEIFNSEFENCSSDETDGTFNSEMGFTKSLVPLDDVQNELPFGKLKDDSSVAASPYLTESASSVPSPNMIKHQSQLRSTMRCNSDNRSEDDSKDVETFGPHPALDEAKLDKKSDIGLPLKATPLSNRERLVLRKQALSMKKRPVLSIGRNNVITGVAKTIKTHFKKHPLAIVNIKNRAEGTPIQQLISELEEATGSVMVSREPNKVILYRSWGAEEMQKGFKENDTYEGEIEVISPQLLDAIRLECGLHPGEVE